MNITITHTESEIHINTQRHPPDAHVSRQSKLFSCLKFFDSWIVLLGIHVEINALKMDADEYAIVILEEIKAKQLVNIDQEQKVNEWMNS